MPETIRDRWMKLCEQARQEQDTIKLIQLVEEINDLLEIEQRQKAKLMEPPAESSVKQ